MPITGPTAVEIRKAYVETREDGVVVDCGYLSVVETLAIAETVRRYSPGTYVVHTDDSSVFCYTVLSAGWQHTIHFPE